MEKLKAKRDGSAYGRETGRSYAFSEGDVVWAADGDLDHFGTDFASLNGSSGDEDEKDDSDEETKEAEPEPGEYETRPLTPKDLDAGPFQRGDHKGGGYYEVLDAEGNTVEGEDGDLLDAGQGRDKADAQLEALNESL